MSRRRDDIDELLEKAAVITVLGIAYWIWQYFSNPSNFWNITKYVVFIIIVSVLILIIWSQYKKKRRQKLLKSFESGELKDRLNNFILSFGNLKTKNHWCVRDHCFDEDRLSDFNKQLRGEGLKITKDELKLIIENHIQEMEFKVTRKSTEIKPSFLDSLDGTRFETLLMRLYTAMGYTVQKIGGVGDQGGDLILNQNGQRILIQAKRYTGSVGNAAVQEAGAAKKHYNCLDAWVVTTGHFTSEAIALAKTNDVRLVGKNELQKDLLEYLKENWA